MAKYAGAIDQGTTGTRFMVFSHDGKVVSSDYLEHEQIYPKPGWVEHDPMEIWSRTQAVTTAALQKGGIQAGDLAAIGVTNQRETAVVWEKAAFWPLHRSKTAPVFQPAVKATAGSLFCTRATVAAEPSGRSLRRVAAGGARVPSREGIGSP